MSKSAKNKRIVLVDIESENLDELMEVLSFPNATISSSVAASKKVVYIIEHD